MRSTVPDGSGSTENDPAPHPPAPTTVEDAVWGPTRIESHACAEATAEAEAEAEVEAGAGAGAGALPDERAGAWRPLAEDGDAPDAQASEPGRAVRDAVGCGMRGRDPGTEVVDPVVPAAPDAVAGAGGAPGAGAGEATGESGGVGTVTGSGQGVGDELVGADLVWGAPEPVPEAAGSTVLTRDSDTWWDTTGRRHPVIANETTASIPVHLLFRDDPGRPLRPVGVRRPPVPRTPQAPAAQPPAERPQLQAPTRPAPAADPRLVERPGPVLPGWAALVAGAAGIGVGLVALWESGALPAAALERLGIGPRPYEGIGIGTWAVLALLVLVVLFALGGIGRGRVGYASVLTLFGDYRGSVRRTGLIWVSPLLLRNRVDVRLRHWRSEPLPAVDASGTALRVVVLVVWRVRDTVRATLGVADHEVYLREQVEAALARVLSQLPADAFNEDTHTLRDAEAVGDALTRVLKADCASVGIEVYSAQPTAIEYAPEVAAAMLRCRVAAIDARHRDRVLTSVVDAVDDTVNRLTSRGIVQLDDYEHKALVRDLTVAFYAGHSVGDRARGVSAAR